MSETFRKENAWFALNKHIITRVSFLIQEKLIILSRTQIVISRLSFNKTSIVIGWFFVMQLLPARRIQQHVFAIWLFEGKSKYITKHLMYGISGN